MSINCVHEILHCVQDDKMKADYILRHLSSRIADRLLRTSVIISSAERSSVHFPECLCNISSVKFRAIFTSRCSSTDAVNRYPSTLPKYRKNMPTSTRIRSTTLLLRFFSWKTIAPNRKDTTTLPRRTIDTMEIMEPSRLNA